MARVTLQLKSWNAAELLSRSERILEAFGPVIAEEAQKQLTLVQWDWPSNTLRFRSIGGLGTPKGKGVYVPAGLRDISDRGRLAASQQAPVVSGNTLSIAWTAPYAKLVQRGGMYSSYINPEGTQIGPRKRPGRDWISRALVARPLEPFFVQKWRELASGSR